MLGYVSTKNALKYIAGCTSAAAALLNRAGTVRGGCIFNYHRVVDVGTVRTRTDNWNVTPERFEQQARWIASEAECVPLDRLLERVRSKSISKPLVALTFDDGYANFRHSVLPVLQRYNLPATLSVVTRYVGSPSPFPFDSWGQKVVSLADALAWRPILWAELQKCIGSGLVSVGSHSHSHLSACDCTDEELLQEAVISRELIQSKLGADQAKVFSYPYGYSRRGLVTPGYVTAVQRAGYRMALTTDLGLVSVDASPFLLPRIEAHGWDSPAILRAKANGYLVPFRLLQGLRRERHFRAAR